MSCLKVRRHETAWFPGDSELSGVILTQNNLSALWEGVWSAQQRERLPESGQKQRKLHMKSLFLHIRQHIHFLFKTGLVLNPDSGTCYSVILNNDLNLSDFSFSTVKGSDI